MLSMAVIAQKMESEKPVSALVASTAAVWHQVVSTSIVFLHHHLYLAHTTNQSRAAAELWFGGDDDMVTWEPSLKPWLVE